MVDIKIATIHNLIKKAGAYRVSKEASIVLGKALNNIGFKIAKEAITYAQHAGRTTVKERDIEIALKKVFKQ